MGPAPAGQALGGRAPAGGPAVRLSSASSRALGVAPIRLALGGAALAIAVVRGLSPLPAVAAAAAGGIVLVLLGAGQRSRAGLKTEREPLQVPPGTRFDRPWLAAMLACVPSTIGVGVMAAAALTFSPALGAVLAGVLLALGLLALVSGVQLAARERAEGVRYWLERGPRPRLFVSDR